MDKRFENQDFLDEVRKLLDENPDFTEGHVGCYLVNFGDPDYCQGKMTCFEGRVCPKLEMCKRIQEL